MSDLTPSQTEPASPVPVFRESLKARLTFLSLTIFLVCIWSLAYYMSETLHKDLKRLLGEITVAADGTLTGTPGPGDVGLQSFAIRVTDIAAASAHATLEFQVVAAIIADANGNGILDNWETTMFGSALPSGNPPTGDPDFDGLSNLLEFALNSHPLQANASPIIHDVEIIDGERYLRLTVPKNRAAANLTFSVETSNSAEEWSTAIVESDTADELIVRDSVAQSAAPQRFIRLKVTVNP